MAKGGNTWQKKLMAKDTRLAMRSRYGSMVPLMARSKSTYAEKVLALKQHRDLIEQHSHNPAPVYDGTGLPDEVIKPSEYKTPEQRALLDKRIALPMKAGWKPRPWGKKIRQRVVSFV